MSLLRCGAVFIVLVVVAAAQHNFFERLGVDRGASEAEVKKAYKKLVRTMHPDMVPPEKRDAARVKFREITEAYEVLSDPRKRQQYEQSGGHRPHSSGDDRQYLRHNLFTQFDGVELRDTTMNQLISGPHDTHIVYFWSSNYPDCIDFAAPFKLLATRLKGTSVVVASFKCDDDFNMCRRLGMNGLPSIKVFPSKGPVVDYTGKIEIVALTAEAARYLEISGKIIESSSVFITNTTPNPSGSLAQYGLAGNYLWETTKKSHLGELDFGLIALEFSPCFDCETALQLAVETVGAVIPSMKVRRINCKRPSNAEFCAPYREKDRAWTLLTIKKQCWYATKQPYRFSNEVCEAPQYRLFQGKFANDVMVNFIVSGVAKGWELPWTPKKASELKQSNDSWAILFDDTDDVASTHRVQWALLARSINTITPVRTPKGNHLRVATANCATHPTVCSGFRMQRPFVAIYGFGTKAKSADPVTYPKISGWKAMRKDLITDAQPLHLHVLNPKNYDKKINGGLAKGRSWFVLYNAGEWCPPCNMIRQPWKDAVRIAQNSPQKKKIAFAIVECDKHKQLCNGLGIQNYPTMTFLGKGRPKVEYNGPRDGHEIAKFGIDQLDNRMMTLHPGDMNSRIQRGDSILVCFSAGAWCPPCTAIAPVMKKVSNLLDKAVVSSFNCDENPHFCNSFGIDGYPTVALFTKGKRFFFESNRKDEKSIAAWANQFLG